MSNQRGWRYSDLFLEQVERLAKRWNASEKNVVERCVDRIYQQELLSMITIRRNQLSVVTRDELGIDKWPSLSWSDAPAALIIETNPHKTLASQAVWGLPEEMGVEEAWQDFDHADEYNIID